MLKVSNEKIYLVRGDDEALALILTVSDSEDEEYTLGADETLTLTVREQPSAEYPVLFSSTSAPGSNRIVIRHEDTVGMEYGAYSADIQLTQSDGRRRTVWPTNITDTTRHKVQNMRNFILASEVTLA